MHGQVWAPGDLCKYDQLLLGSIRPLPHKVGCADSQIPRRQCRDVPYVLRRRHTCDACPGRDVDVIVEGIVVPRVVVVWIATVAIPAVPHRVVLCVVAVAKGAIHTLDRHGLCALV